MNCPFCGSTKQKLSKTLAGPVHAMRCMTCCANGPITGTAIAAEEAWDSRYGVDGVDETSSSAASKVSVLADSIGVQFAKLHPNAIPPSQAHSTDACFDLACVEEIILPSGLFKASTTLVPTGLALIPSPGYWLQIESRSGLASKGVFVIGGIIDSGYRGEVKVILINQSTIPVALSAGSRIAQVAIRKHYTAAFTEIPAESLSSDAALSSDRGANGFGSTDGAADIGPKHQEMKVMIAEDATPKDIEELKAQVIEWIDKQPIKERP